MESSVQLADIHKRVPAYGTEARVICSAAGRIEIRYDEKRGDFIGCGIVVAYGGKGNDAQRSWGDARLRRQTHDEEG